MHRAEPHADQAPRAPLPARFEPQLATLAARAPAGERWLHEIKYDGYRIGCLKDGKQVRLFSRRGNEWTRTLPWLCDAARRLNARQALLDGELAALDPDGRTDFQRLQAALGGAKADLVYIAFDLLHLDGRDLTRLPLEERKRLLEQVVPSLDEGIIRRSRSWIGHGPELFEKACELGLEGIVCKRRDAAYRAGRSDCWLKVKCTASDVFVIGGFTEPEGGGRSELGALLLGRASEEGDHLTFVGKVGTGFSMAMIKQLRALLDPERTGLCPFDPRPPGRLGREGRWVRPVHRAKVRFTEWTHDGQLRHPAFLGLCDPPERIARGGGLTVQAEPPRQRPHEPVPPPRGRVIPHEDDVLWHQSGVTRREVIAHYERVAEWMLPHLQGRPLTVVRCKKDLASCTFMHHAGNLWAPPEVPRVHIRERTKIGEYLVVERPEHLIGLVRAGVIELHTWNTRAHAVDQPDRLVFDLDPGPDVRWAEVVSAARWLREALRSLGLESLVKTTGGAGLHVVVPIVPRDDWSHCFAFTRAFATLAAKERPIFTTALSRKGREAKILIDYLRNNRTNTSVAAYSVRARPELTVSVPLAWEELSARLDPAKLTMEAVRRRLARRKEDPWAAAEGLKQSLPMIG